MSDTGSVERKKEVPSMDQWLKEAKEDKRSTECGMYLFHNGVVRKSAKAKARMNGEAQPVTGMLFSSNKEKISAAIEETCKMPGIHYVRVWLNEGRLEVGDDIMLVLVGGDIRPHVVDALEALVGELKENCITETELF
jgi:molybdopterin synthase catalytic subunit